MEKKYKTNDIWDAEAKTSFVKAVTDWFSFDKYNSRLHLSFVKHNGMKPATAQYSIEIGVPMVKAGSDGYGETGITALSLANDILSGRLAWKAQQARDKAAQEGKAYADDIFACIGATTKNRSKTGVPEFRKFSISPGKTFGTYALKASRCEGEESATGGVQPKVGAQYTQIIVPVSESYLITLGQYIESEWNAFLVARQMAEINGQAENNTQPVNPTVPQSNVPAVSQEQIPVAPQADDVPENLHLCIAYDQTQSVNGGLPFAIRGTERAVMRIRGTISAIQAKTGMTANKASCDKAKQLIRSGQKGKCVILFENPQNSSRKGVLVVVCDDCLQ